MNMWASRRAFTIVEMTVVIVVIAILATLGAVSYTVILGSGRDADRQAHIVQYKLALEKYYADNAEFPGVCASDGVPCDVALLETELAEYMDVMPTDPLSPEQDYAYIRGGTDGNAYGLYVQYEQEEACKTGVRVNQSWWSTDVKTCN